MCISGYTNGTTSNWQAPCRLVFACAQEGCGRIRTQAVTTAYSAGREKREGHYFSLSSVWLSIISLMALSVHNMYNFWLRKVLKILYGTLKAVPFHHFPGFSGPPVVRDSIARWQRSFLAQRLLPALPLTRLHAREVRSEGWRNRKALN